MALLGSSGASSPKGHHWKILRDIIGIFHFLHLGKRSRIASSPLAILGGWDK